MRVALLKLAKPDERAYVAERFSDVPVVKIIKEVSAPSVLDLRNFIPVGDSFSTKEIAKRTGATEQSVRTNVSSCNSKARSNAKFHKTGLRFEMQRGEDKMRRTK